MAGGAAVVVEIDAVLDGGLDEAQHLRALMRHDIAIVVEGTGDAEVDAEAGAETLHLGVDAVTGEEPGEAVVQEIGDSVDVTVEARPAIRPDGCQGRGDDDRMTVIGPRVL